MAASIASATMAVAAGSSAAKAAPAGGLLRLPARPCAAAAQLGSRSSAMRGLSVSGAAPSARAARVNTLVTAEEEQGGRGGRGRGRGGRGGRGRGRGDGDGFEERVVQVRRVTKVVKGGKQLSFRAVVIVGNKKGKVGVGCAAAKEVVSAVQKAALVARQEAVTIPLTRGQSFPHRVQGRHGAASVMLRPAAEGCGVIAGGATRVVMELAGIRNGFGKQLGTANPLNNARATVEGLSRLRTWKQVADTRGLSVSYLMGLDQKEEASA